MSRTSQVRYHMGFIISGILFLGLAFALGQGEPGPLWGDQAVQDALMKLRTDAWTDVMRIVTQIGSTYAFVVVLLAVGIILVRNRRVPEALFLLIQLAAAFGLYKGLKGLFDRPRPAIDLLIDATGSSFPSGNALMAAAFYAFAGMLLARLPFVNKAGKTVIALICALVILGAGFSRLYLGVHYASDILAGYAAGATLYFAVAWVMNKIVR